MDDDSFFKLVQDNVFSASSAAKYLGISRAGLSKAILLGRLRCTDDRLFIRADLDRYKETAKVGRPVGTTKAKSKKNK